MRLATIADGSRDGRLVVVSSGLDQAIALQPWPTLQAALEDWGAAKPALQAASAGLDRSPDAFDFDPKGALAPLPRAWQWLDGSAFHSHGDLMQKVFNMDATPKDRPLMYQGLSDTFYSSTQDVPFPDEADGIDFEGEFGVIVDETPMGASPDEADKHIRLVVQINDWSLRSIAPIEMRTGFGWVQAKPPCSMAPIAVTPEELGASWRDGRVDLALEVTWNDRPFGAAKGHAMAFSFPELVSHAARTRRLCAGTVIGSGTVSNANFREIGSSCIAERRGIEILDQGSASTAYMRFGDEVSMTARDASGHPFFGSIRQRVVQG